MRATSSLSQPESLELRPHRMQFVIDNLPSLVVCCAGGIYGGMEGVPYPVVGVAVFLCLMLVLLYRFIYLCRIRYRIGTEQLVCERGRACPQGGLHGTLPCRGLSGTPEPDAAALRTENGAHLLDRPEHATARPDGNEREKRHRASYPGTGGIQQTKKGNI